MYLNGVTVDPLQSGGYPQPSWVNDALEIGKGLLVLKQQNALQNINTERLKQGLAPLDASEAGAQVKVAMDKQQLNKILLVVGAVSVIGFLLLRKG